MGIVGHSFGGYSTLLGVTYAPELFKVGVASAPPSDMTWAMRDMADTGYGKAEGWVPLKVRLRALGFDVDAPATVERVRAQSPERNAARVGSPLLLVAGEKDQRIAIRSVTHYAAQLKALGKQVGLLVDPTSDHNLEAPLARRAYLFLLEAMLHQHLGGKVLAESDAELEAYLARNLRLGAEELRLANRAR